MFIINLSKNRGFNHYYYKIINNHIYLLIYIEREFPVTGNLTIYFIFFMIEYLYEH